MDYNQQLIELLGLGDSESFRKPVKRGSFLSLPPLLMTYGRAGLVNPQEVVKW